MTNSEIRRQFAERLMLLMKNSGLDAEAFASDLNVSVNSIYNYRSGRSSPDLEFFVYIYENFGVDLNWLVSGEGEMYRERIETSSSLDDSDDTPASVLLSLISEMIDSKLEGKVIEKRSEVRHLRNTDGVILNSIRKKVKK